MPGEIQPPFAVKSTPILLLSRRPVRVPLPAVLMTALALLTTGMTASGAEAETGRAFHVAANGDDNADGLTPGSAWRSLRKINGAELKPGDRVLFRRGDEWRGQLVPKSGREGAPVTYAAFGTGEKPLLLGSVSRNEEKAWHDEGGGVWSTPKPVWVELGSWEGFAARPWSIHTEEGAKVKTTRMQGASAGAAESGGAQALWRLDGESSGSKGNHIQLSTAGLEVREGECYALTFRARCTKPFAIAGVRLMKNGPPYTSYGGGNARPIEVGADWRDFTVRFEGTMSAPDGRITLFLGGALPAGASFDFAPVSWKRVECGDWGLLPVDVGNIVFDHRQAGVKKWRAADLKQVGDFWYDGDNWQVWLRSDGNPAAKHSSIELALQRHIVDQGGQSHVVYEGLALRYGAAHGFGGGSTRGIVIRDCDISWIGGGHHLTKPDGKPVRFGNGVEFWSSARDCLVEGCRIWEIYDAALTNQGSGANEQIGITYRDNVIWNSEYSFEYWNRGPESVTRNIVFEHNTCVNAGSGWAHSQRPDPNGRHLMFYSNPAKTDGFLVRNNIFCASTESGLRMENDWTRGLTMERNCWWQRDGVLIRFLKTSYAPGEFAGFQKQTGLEADSIVADPRFTDAGDLDFSLAGDSPARRLSADGKPAGARRRLKE